MALKKVLESRGFEVIEIFPGASFDMLGIPRKDVAAANRFLGCDARNAHESDAAIGAYTLKLHMEGGGLLLSGRDGSIAIPRPPRGSPSFRCP
jgi:predicted nuclease with RNAse H fold